ncbi:MAG: type I-E CRISPR-associated protein Cse2/CasB [Steroidobacteraceae bacterium]
MTISDTEGDRGVRAQLRRCGTPLDAVTVPAAISLARRLGRVPERGAPPWKQKGFERALSLAIVLAHVRVNTSTNLLRTLGWGQFPHDKKETDATEGRPLLSELRFKRFLQTDGEDQLVTAFSRLVALAGDETDVTDLARVFLTWDDDRTKRDLALTYFRATTTGLDARD